MACDRVEFSGKELGQHGCNVYFKEFVIWHDFKRKRYRLGEFYFVKSRNGNAVFIAEFQLIWQSLKTGEKLASLKLYFAPEDTPEGRLESHGTDELLEADHHVAIECSQMSQWQCDVAYKWPLGAQAYDNVDSFDLASMLGGGQCRSHDNNDECPTHVHVKLLSFPSYCRYRACVKLLLAGYKLERRHLLAKGGIELAASNTKIMFCRWKFHHPSLDESCPNSDAKLPVFKGRPRKRKLRMSKCKIMPADVKKTTDTMMMMTTAAAATTSSEPIECHTHRDEHIAAVAADVNAAAVTAAADVTAAAAAVTATVLLLPAKKTKMVGMSDPVTTKKEPYPNKAKFKPKAKLFDVSDNDLEILMGNMCFFMKERGTPILKVPKVGYTRVNLALLFTLVHAYGGYKQVTFDHRWKVVYDGLGLATTITNAATCIRRHYERLLLPYEKHFKHPNNKGRSLFASHRNNDVVKNDTTSPVAMTPGTTAAAPYTNAVASPPHVVNDSSQTTTVTESGTQTDAKRELPTRLEPCVDTDMKNSRAGDAPKCEHVRMARLVKPNAEHVTTNLVRVESGTQVTSTYTEPRVSSGPLSRESKEAQFNEDRIKQQTPPSPRNQGPTNEPKSQKSCTEHSGFSRAFQTSHAPKPPPLVPIVNDSNTNNDGPSFTKRCRFTPTHCPPFVANNNNNNGSRFGNNVLDYKKISISSILPDMKMTDVESDMQPISSDMQPISSDMHGTLEDIRRAVSRSIGFPMPAALMNSNGRQQMIPYEQQQQQQRNRVNYDSFRRSPTVCNDMPTYRRHQPMLPHQLPLKAADVNDSYNRLRMAADMHSRGDRLPPVSMISDSSRGIVFDDRLAVSIPSRVISANDRYLSEKADVNMLSQQQQQQQQAQPTIHRYPAELYGWQQLHDTSMDKRRNDLMTQCYWLKDDHVDRSLPHVTAYRSISKTF